uniref:PML-orf5 n=1 Tax=Methanohalophilus mahii TaxID=2176 RepID=Q6QWE3_9EURY|nr:pML-orf5 [Methanohalophilus mahii]
MDVRHLFTYFLAFWCYSLHFQIDRFSIFHVVNKVLTFIGIFTQGRISLNSI